MKKVLKPKEEPKKEEVKRTKVKVPKAKKYEDLPEIPDYERPELEIYEESEFDPSKATKPGEQPAQKSETPVESQAQSLESTKNGLPKVSWLLYFFFICMYCILINLITGLISLIHAHQFVSYKIFFVVIFKISIEYYECTESRGTP